MSEKRKRKTDPEVARLRGQLGIAVLKGDEQAAAALRQELSEALILSAVKVVAAQMLDLPPEKRERARSLLLSALDAGGR